LHQRTDADGRSPRSDADSTRTFRIAQQRALPSVQALLAAAVVSAEQVDAAVAEQTLRGGRVLEILVAGGAVTDDVIATTLARAAARPLLGEAELGAPVEASLVRRMPRTYALARRLLPLRLVDGALLLAVADPFDGKVIDEVRALLHATSVDVRVAPRAALTRATLAAFGAGDVVVGPRVLLGHHDDAKAQALGARLAQEGMQVEHVVEGATARQILSMNPPHAVLCAHDLPEVDGRTLLMFVRGNDRLVELPFYVLGPRGDDDLAARLLELGADDFFSEPLRGDVIVAKLRRAVGKRVESAPPAPPPRPARPEPKNPAAPADEFAFDDLPDLPPELDGGDEADDVPAMPTGVMGTLRQMSLPEIVQSLEMGRKTASVDIVPQDGEKGRIAFTTGAIQFAECGALSGDQAFYALMRHREGFFRIHYGDSPPSVNINAPTTFLLLEAMRLMDEEGGTGGA
jgi:CheY-like chemotaxis protein